MPEPSRDPQEARDEQRLWERLSDAPPVEIDPFFAKRVTRAAHETPSRGWFFARLAGLVTAPTAAALLLFVAREPGANSVAAPLAALTPPPLPIELAAVAYVDYFDEIVALENPALLSDADLIELIIDDGSSALLF